MEVVNSNETQKSTKPSYDEIVARATELQNQNRYLIKQLQDARDFIALRRLDYLFKCLEMKDIFDEDFLGKCAQEVVEAMYPSEEVNNTETETKE